MPKLTSLASGRRGYYTTRPKLKLLARVAGATVRTAEWMFALATARVAAAASGGGAWAAAAAAGLCDAASTCAAELYDDLESARRGVALVQHHDAITGTSRNNVVLDYQKLLNDAARRAARLAAAAAATLLAAGGGGDAAATLVPLGTTADGRLELDVGAAANGSVGGALPIVLLSAAAAPRCELVVAKVRTGRLALTDARGAPLDLTLLARPPTDAKAKDDEVQEAAFVGCAPGLGASTVFLRRAADARPPPRTVAAAAERWKADRFLGAPSALALRAGCTSATLQPNGMLQSLGCGAGARVDVVQSVASYEDEGGAYIFKARTGGEPFAVDGGDVAVRRSPLLEDATLRTAAFRSTVRVSEHSAAAAADVASAELHVACSAPSNRDIVVRLKTSLRRGRLLIHDGYALASRAASAPLDAAIGAIAHGPDAEFYPTAVGAALAQDDTLLLVVADRAVGVASRGSDRHAGELEVLVHRSTAQDDGRGLGSPAPDASTVRTRLWVVWGEARAVTAAASRLVAALEAPLHLMRGRCGGGAAALCEPPQWRAAFLPSFGAAAAATTATATGYAPSVALRVQDNASTRVLLRLQRACTLADEPRLPRCGDASADGAVRSLLAPPWRLRAVREVGLTGGPLPGGGAAAAPAGDVAAEEEARGGGGGREAAGWWTEQATVAREDARIEEQVARSAQNSGEDGVFVSDAALKHGTAADEVAAAATRLPTPTHVDFDPANYGSYAGDRKLLAAAKRAPPPPPPPSAAELEALELRAFEAELVYDGAGAAAAEVATLPGAGAAAAAAEAGTTTTAPARGGGRAAVAPTQASPARWPQQALVVVLAVVILARCRKQGRRGAVAVAAERAAPTKSR